MAVKELSIEVYGRVQGVGFRTSLVGVARKLGIKGFVRNKEDGGVEVIAQGEKKELEKLLDWINGSHVLSDIIGLSYHWGEAVNTFNDFSVKSKNGFVLDKAKGILNLGKKLFYVKELDSLNIQKSQTKTQGLFDYDKIKNKPLHVVIIPDGNRRWAEKRGLNSSFGHYKAGIIDNVLELFDEAKKLGIKYFSIWAFSTENWKRDEKEIEAIFSLVLRSIDKLKAIAHKDRIRFRHIGRKDRMPKELLNALTELENETAKYDDFNVQLCLDYGGRDEIVRVVNKLIKKKVESANEEMIKNELDSAGIPDPDLIIRTSGEKRLSGFMPFQSVYSELCFVDEYFPDFKASDLRKVVEEFRNRNRRFGG